MAAGRPADLHHRDRPDHAQHPGAGAAESRGRARDRCGNRPARGVALSDRPCERATAGRAAVGSLRPPAGCARRPRAHRDHEPGRARSRQYHEPRRRAHHAGGRRGKRPRGRARHRARPVHARARRRDARPDRHRDGHRADLRPADRRDSRDRLRLALDLPVRGHGSICGAGMGGGSPAGDETRPRCRGGAAGLLGRSRGPGAQPDLSWLRAVRRLRLGHVLRLPGRRASCGGDDHGPQLGRIRHLVRGELVRLR